MTVRVRFAPSPTGFLHIGGVRTALFNYLFAKKNKGTFLLRIEDTDEERSTQASTDAIFEGMQWMNLLWDEGPMTDGTSKGPDAPYYQAQRADMGIYKKYIDQLLAEGKAYKCYCTCRTPPAEIRRQVRAFDTRTAKRIRGARPQIRHPLPYAYRRRRGMGRPHPRTRQICQQRFV